MPTNPEHPDDRLSLPPALREALRELDRADLDVPESVDAAVREAGVRAAARARDSGDLARGRRHWTGRTALRWGLAAAALIVVGVVLWSVQLRDPQSPLRFGDVDGDGQVDIRDALLLSLELEREGRVARDRDLNHDGRVDGDDVSALMALAVRLDARHLNPGTR